jgi:hypothetical protein
MSRLGLTTRRTLPSNCQYASNGTHVDRVACSRLRIARTYVAVVCSADCGAPGMYDCACTWVTIALIICAATRRVSAAQPHSLAVRYLRIRSITSWVPTTASHASGMSQMPTRPRYGDAASGWIAAVQCVLARRYRRTTATAASASSPPSVASPSSVWAIRTPT